MKISRFCCQFLLINYLAIEDPNDTDPQDTNYDPNDDIKNIEVTERKFDVKYAEDPIIKKYMKASKARVGNVVADHNALLTQRRPI